MIVRAVEAHLVIGVAAWVHMMHEFEGLLLSGRLRKVADMTKIKIVSNPYNRSLSYYIFKPQLNAWEDIKQDSINSRLREDDEEKIFLPFKVKEIIDTIITEYHVGADPIELVFEGTADEYEELLNICNDSEVRDKVHLFRSNRVLENARDILDHAKEIFDTVQPIIKNIVKDDEEITKGLFKVSDI